MNTQAYPPPIDRLIVLGNAWEMESWPDYLALGLGPQHIPDLIRLATDPELNEADSDSKEVWAPAHAWRALAQLGAQEAAGPLTALFRRIDEYDDDFVGEDLPVAFGLLGAGAIPPLAACLAAETNGLWARVAASRSLAEIGRRHSGARVSCVGALARQLERFAEQDPDLNGFLVHDLLDLKGVEALAVMERAFAADCVEVAIVGDWEDIQISLGLKRGRDRPQRPSPALRRIAEVLDLLEARSAPDRGQPTSQAEFEARAERAALAARLSAAAGPKRKRRRKKRK